MGALPPNPRDLSHGANPGEARKARRGGRVRPVSGLGPWVGARVGSHRCPILRPGQTSIAHNKQPRTKESNRSHFRRVLLGLSGHLPPCLCVRKERLSEFRGAAAAAVGKISDVANSVIARGRYIPGKRSELPDGICHSPAARSRVRHTKQLTLWPSPYRHTVFSLLRKRPVAVWIEGGETSLIAPFDNARKGMDRANE
jgi:hypothetical protein